MSTSIEEIMKRLAEPFDPETVEWKPQTVRENRALAVAYVDARAIEDRLDEVLGIGGWQDHYEVLEGGCVVCTLKIRLPGETEWLCKTDVGSPSDQPDKGDKVKASFSDALKRAAVKVGIGRYLYRLPMQWAEFDPQKKRFVKEPTLPSWALPKRMKPEQMEELKTLLTETDTNEEKFLDALVHGELLGRPEKVESIPVALFEKSRKMLRTKKARLAQEAAMKEATTTKESPPPPVDKTPEKAAVAKTGQKPAPTTK